MTVHSLLWYTEFFSPDLLSLGVFGQNLLYALDFVIVSFAREDIRSVRPRADANVRRDAGTTYIRGYRRKTQL